MNNLIIYFQYLCNNFFFTKIKINYKEFIDLIDMFSSMKNMSNVDCLLIIYIN